MKRSTRILIAGVVIELLLFGIGYYLLEQMRTGALTPSGSAAEAASTITTIIGGAMGALGAIVMVMYLVVRL
ncbi:MAG TPA: hypothetical protein DCL48_08300, partial [Alphaproteobacteria bacterium]|nr:hypothetical protein [Alphaproteobacteria bacterium]